MLDTLLKAARSEPGGMAGGLLCALSSEAGPQHLTFPDHTLPQKSFVTALQYGHWEGEGGGGRSLAPSRSSVQAVRSVIPPTRLSGVRPGQEGGSRAVIAGLCLALPSPF